MYLLKIELATSWELSQYSLYSKKYEKKPACKYFDLC